ncbi:hypothetical protein L6164_029927 [Bauhinia variegata]|uniref:Uncharacterized protein n=1 Tax=Bauhinia variegata TaxID=167791 RepID=A0ACB9LAQ5_BAUVA|nr:hypothetical protein L6164_029927 [Bauhinia variegata]
MNDRISQPSYENYEDLVEDIWGVAGLVLGLGISVGAIYRAGELEAVRKIKSLVISWIPYVNSQVQSAGFQGIESEIALSVGSCIAIPTIVAFCWRMELMSKLELEHVVNGFKELISELTSVTKSGVLHQSLLMAACIGAGTVLGCTLNEGFYSIEAECVKGLLGLFTKCYSNPYPSLVHLGGMIGIVNAMGAGVGIPVHLNIPHNTMQSGHEKKLFSSGMGSLLSSDCESYLTSLVQEMFLVAQNSDDHQLQEFASWSLSFLRHHLWSKELLDVDGDRNAAETNLKSVTQSFAEDNVVLKLSLWLMDLNKSSKIAHVGTIVTALRCLSRAPRLPSLDWGGTIRRCMRYEAPVAQLLPTDSTFDKGTLREECVRFALAHANKFDSLLTFLDELSDLSRFRTLELNLQSCLLIHLADLVKVYSSSRLEKLFSDVSYHLSSVASYQETDPYQGSLLRISCWKGLYQCLDEVSLDTLDYISHVERCMEVLFNLLPVLQSSGNVGSLQVNSAEEWSEAVRCLGKAPQNWLLDFLKVSHVDYVQSADKSIDIQKKIRFKAKLVKRGTLSLIEMGKIKSYILNSKIQGEWDVLVDVVVALYHAEGIVKRQWLVDALEISCVTAYPSTAMQFLGLLSAICSKYMPILVVDQHTVLNDLPVTLTSLLTDQGWSDVAEAAVSYLYSSTERIYHWATQTADGTHVPSTQPIDESENHMAVFLFQVMHHTCVLLKGHLPLDRQLKLAGMVLA